MTHAGALAVLKQRLEPLSLSKAGGMIGSTAWAARHRSLRRSNPRRSGQPGQTCVAAAQKEPLPHDGHVGAGTTTVKSTLNRLFRREGITSVAIEGDAFHRYDRAAMKAELDARKAAGDQTFSHFSHEAHELAELESHLFHLRRHRQGPRPSLWA